MFKTRQFIATTKHPASLIVSNTHFNVVIENSKVTVYHEIRGIESVLHIPSIKNLDVAKITKTASQKRCSVSLANDKGYIDLQSVSGTLVISLFNDNNERQTQLLIKE